ncbi:MAG: SDR family NAD(P)-dependent oxidoreductase [Gemmatimonadota bacterium]
MLGIDLRGKRAVVTGGSRGIGRSVAILLARAGADVGISYYNRDDTAAAVLKELRACDVRAFAERGDLADERAADQLIERAVTEFGGLDIFIANAGIWPPEYHAIESMPAEHWRRTMAVNLDSVFFTTRAAARRISEGGRIVLISSTAGQRGEAGHVDYAASKGAMIAMVKGLCIELAPRQVTVNSVAPGWVDTEMAAAPYAGEGRTRIEAGIPIGRVASADDIAGPVVFLCSDFARHITGEILNVNGGSVLCG